MVSEDFIPEIFYLVNVILGAIGFYIAYKVAKSKRKSEKLVCSINHNCNEVVTSKYSKLFGIELTTYGMSYYGLVVLSYVALELFDDFVWNAILTKIVFAISLFAGVFSWYLMSVMFMKLKMKCDWCIASAIISNGIAFISILAYLYI